MSSNEWVDVSGYEGLYKVCRAGFIWSLRRGKYYFGSLNTRGYLMVKLTKNKQTKMFQVHRLVALAFIPNTHNLPQINHKDENKTNNAVDNLEWVTNWQNNHYGTRVERMLVHPGRAATYKKTSKPVLQYDLTNKFIKRWESARTAARELGISNGNINNCLQGRIKTAYKSLWIYAQEEGVKNNESN